jgi:hypothetical protein
MGSGSSQSGGTKSSSSGGKMGSGSSQSGGMNSGPKSSGPGGAGGVRGGNGTGGSQRQAATSAQVGSRDNSGTGIGGLLGSPRSGPGGAGGVRTTSSGTRQAQTSSRVGGLLGGVSRPGSYAGPKGALALNNQALVAAAGPYGHYDDPRQMAMQRLMARGWAPNIARGIVGNFNVESAGMNPMVGGDFMGGQYTARGLAQWRGDRLDALERETNRPFTGSGRFSTSGPSFDQQVDFADRELKGLSSNIDTGAVKVGQQFNANPNMTTAQAARTFARGYERPAASALKSSIGERIASGNIALDGGNQTPSMVGAVNPSKMQDRIAAEIDPRSQALPSPKPAGLAAAVAARNAPAAFEDNRASSLTPGFGPMADYESQRANSLGPTGFGPMADFESNRANSLTSRQPLARQGPGLLASPNINLGRTPGFGPMAAAESQRASSRTPGFGPMAAFESQRANSLGSPGFGPMAAYENNKANSLSPGFGPMGPFESQRANSLTPGFGPMAAYENNKAPTPPNPYEGIAQGIPNQPGKTGPVEYDIGALQQGPLGPVADAMKQYSPLKGKMAAGAIKMGFEPIGTRKMATQGINWAQNQLRSLTGTPSPPTQVASNASGQNELRDVQGGQMQWTGQEPPQVVAQMQQHVEEILRAYLSPQAGVA